MAGDILRLASQIQFEPIGIESSSVAAYTLSSAN